MEFVKPQEAYLDGYLDACRESFEHNITDWMPVTPDRFDSWRAQALNIFAALESGAGLPEGIPRMVTYFAVEGGCFIGEVQLRPYADAQTAEAIGHAGYVVRFSEWGKGHGTALLRFAVQELRKYGVSPVIIVCGESNAASCRVCEKVGFRLAERRETQSGAENVYIIE